LKYKFLVKKLKKFFIISIIKFFEYRSFIKIFFLIIKFHGILKTADMFSEAIIIQLLRKKKITDIIRSCIYFLTRYYVKKRIGGYHILFSGRFTRKDRAMFRWHKKGKYTRSNRIVFIDYSNKRVALKYSSCAFKISFFKYFQKNIESKL